jgi:TonB family protein
MQYCRFLVLLFVGLFVFPGLQSQEITPPLCYGGERLLKEFIQEEMVYPEEAMKDKKEGIVELSFLVNKKGSISNIKVEKSVADQVDKEAIRILKKILWHPATKIGKPIAFGHSIKIKFKIKKYNKLVKSRGYDKIDYPHEPVDKSLVVYKRKDTDQYPKPIFSSLDRDLGNFISKNLQYPDAAFSQNISGTVVLRFVVEPSGRISNIETLKAVGGGCTQEAIRIVKKIEWYPGLKDNKAVRVCIPLEITFDIAKKSVGGSIPSPGQLQ